jgi:hypothetical protein
MSSPGHQAQAEGDRRKGNERHRGETDSRRVVLKAYPAYKVKLRYGRCRPAQSTLVSLTSPCEGVKHKGVSICHENNHTKRDASSGVKARPADVKKDQRSLSAYHCSNGMRAIKYSHLINVRVVLNHTPASYSEAMRRALRAEKQRHQGKQAVESVDLESVDLAIPALIPWERSRRRRIIDSTLCLAAIAMIRTDGQVRPAWMGHEEPVR